MRAPTLVKESPKALKNYQTQDNAADERERLILEHLPQVRLIARRIHERLPESVNLDDLVSKRIALREVNEGYAALKDGSLNRVVVTSF